MKLLLTSAGFTNRSITNALADLCRKPFDELNLAYIPTAANVESGDKDFMIKALVDCQDLGFKSVDIVDISAIPIEMVKKRLEEAHVLFFGGGNTSHLMYWIQKSGVKEILHWLLTTRVYVGVSAGSMVASRNLILADTPILYREESNADRMEGAGLIDFNIRPHYNSDNFPHVNDESIEVISQNVKDTIVAIDDQTAIKVVDGDMEIVTEGEWKRFN